MRRSAKDKDHNMIDTNTIPDAVDRILDVTLCYIYHLCISVHFLRLSCVDIREMYIHVPSYEKNSFQDHCRWTDIIFE